MGKMNCKGCGKTITLNWGDKDNIYCSDCFWASEKASMGTGSQDSSGQAGESGQAGAHDSGNK